MLNSLAVFLHVVLTLLDVLQAVVVGGDLLWAVEAVANIRIHGLNVLHSGLVSGDTNVLHKEVRTARQINEVHVVDIVGGGDEDGTVGVTVNLSFGNNDVVRVIDHVETEGGNATSRVLGKIIGKSTAGNLGE